MKKWISLLLSAAMLVSLLTGCGNNTGPYVPTGDGLTKDEDYVGATQPPSQDTAQELSLTRP